MECVIVLKSDVTKKTIPNKLNTKRTSLQITFNHRSITSFLLAIYITRSILSTSPVHKEPQLDMFIKKNVLQAYSYGQLQLIFKHTYGQIQQCRERQTYWGQQVELVAKFTQRLIQILFNMLFNNRAFKRRQHVRGPGACPLCLPKASTQPV